MTRVVILPSGHAAALDDCMVVNATKSEWEAIEHAGAAVNLGTLPSVLADAREARGGGLSVAQIIEAYKGRPLRDLLAKRPARKTAGG